MKVNRWIGVVFLIALVARILVLGLLLNYGGEKALILGDTERYLGLAESLARGEGYTFYKVSGEGGAESYRPPGYPAYLFVFKYLNIPLWVAAFLQIIVASLIPLLLFRFAERLPRIPQWIPRGAAVFAALEPVQVFYSVVLLPDAFAALLFLSGSFFVLQWMESKKLRDAFFAGFCIGISNYFRPVALYFVIFFALVLLAYEVWKWKQRLVPQHIAHLAIAVVVAWLVILPWQVRNYITFGSPTFVSAGATNLYSYAAAFAIAIDEGRDFQSVNSELRVAAAREAPEPREFRSLKNKDYLVTRSLVIIREHPWGYVKSYLLGINTFLFSGNYHYLLQRYGLIERPKEIVSFSLVLARDGIGTFWGKVISAASQPYVALALFGKLFWVVVTLGSLAGAWRLRKEPAALLFFMSVGYFLLTLLAVTMGVEARHRYALNPLIFLFFFAALSRILSKSPLAYGTETL